MADEGSKSVCDPGTSEMHFLIGFESNSGLAPGFAGLYQINLQAPDDAPTGAQELQVSASGVNSNTVTVAIR
jgi:hypothetical protein